MRTFHFSSGRVRPALAALRREPRRGISQFAASEPRVLTVSMSTLFGCRTRAVASARLSAPSNHRQTPSGSRRDRPRASIRHRGARGSSPRQRPNPRRGQNSVSSGSLNRSSRVRLPFAICHQHRTRDRVTQIVVRAGPVIDLDLPATRGAAFKADELSFETGMVQQIDHARVNERQQLLVELRLWLRRGLISDPVDEKPFSWPFSRVSIARDGFDAVRLQTDANCSTTASGENGGRASLRQSRRRRHCVLGALLQGSCCPRIRQMDRRMRDSERRLTEAVRERRV